MSKNTKLVWSDDPRDQIKVREDAGKAPRPQDSEDFVKSRQWTAVFRIEKGGRGGKTVTVLDKLPRHETFLKDLCKEFKAKCGSGGTYNLEGDCGQIEIQGDQRASMKALLDKKGIPYKGM